MAGLDGEEITILNTNAASLSILSQSTLSSTNNRIIGAVLVPQFSVVRLKYRTTTNRWTLENVGINDGRYLRKDQNDFTSFNLGVGGSVPSASTFFVETPNSSTGADGVIFRNSNGLNILAIRNSGGVNIQGSSTGTPNTIRNQSLGGIIQFRGLEDINVVTIGRTGRVFANVRSGAFNEFVRRDELPFNYPETVTTSGTINNLSLANEGVKLLILTLADDLTGVVPVTTNTGRELKIEGRNAGGVIIRHDSASSTAANRFSIGADLTIANGEIYTFIYTNARWRRVL